MPSSTRVIIAVDPGAEGAIAITRGQRTLVYDLPMTKDTFLESQRQCLDTVAFHSLLCEAFKSLSNPERPKESLQVVYASEQMQGFGFRTPAKVLMGLAEMSATIETIIRMFCLYEDHALYIRKYKPKTWINWMFPDAEKRGGRESEAKKESIEKAKEIFPHMANFLARQKDHNRAEALLLTFVTIAELSRVTIDPAVKSLTALQKLYHKQRGEKSSTPFTAIYGSWLELHKSVKDHIKKYLT